jgi:hypothetical protein
LDEASKAVIKIFLDFKTKCEDFEETKNDDLKLQPVLPSSEALTAIQGKQNPLYIINCNQLLYRY